MPFNIWLSFINASLSGMQGALETATRLVEPRAASLAPTPEPPGRWTSRNRVVAELPTMRVLDFSTDAQGPGAIVVAPYALHTATTADFARGHSVIEALLMAGITRIALTDWRRAGAAQRYLSIDSCLADLNAVVDDFGAPSALVGLCQGGTLASVYTARFPAKVSRLALVGAPIDIEAKASVISTSVRHTPAFAIETMVEQGGGILRGDQLAAMWPGSNASGRALREALQIRQAGPQLQRRFADWYKDLIDLPGVFYQQTMHWIFRENRLAEGTFPALGRIVGVGAIRCPLFLLAAAQDEVVAPEQLLALAARAATPEEHIVTRITQGQHLALFMGKRILGEDWPDIGRFLRGGPEPGMPEMLETV